MKKAIKVIISIFLLSISWVETSQAQLYSRSADLPPLSLSYEELSVILSDLEPLLTSVNLNKGQLIANGFEVKNEDVKIAFNNPEQMRNFKKLPSIATEFNYTYYRPGAKVASVKLSFNDGFRSLTVEGEDPNQVNSIFASLKEQFERRRNRFGGFSFQLFILILIVIVSLVLGFSGIDALWEKGPSVFAFLKVLTGVALILSNFIIPFRDWLPGFAIYADSASFIVRNQAQISFFSVVLSVFLFGAGIYHNKNKSKRKPKIRQKISPA